MKSVFKCPIYDFYGQNERSCLFSMCSKGIYHIHEEYSFVELQPLTQDDPQTNNIPAQIIATTYHNFAMPLIRYKTGDIAMTHKHTICDCGKTYRTVKKIIGRMDDIIYTPNGLQVARLDNAFKDSPGIKEAQIIQNQKNKILVNIVKLDSFTQADIDHLLYRLNYRLGEQIKIDYQFVDNIPTGQNGKKKFIVSNLDDTIKNEVNTLCVE